MHGQGADRYEHVHVGLNSRLDTIQAAILVEKLKIFPDEIEMREAVARRYSDAFTGNARIVTPVVMAGARSTWAQYTLKVADRARFQAGMKERGVPTAVYYPMPLSRQKAYAHFPSAPVPVATELCGQVVSLPMHPYLDPATQDRIVAAALASAA
jgi:dTDP-4-amino-4,6-dideoxygalactose transaminase